MTNEEYVKAIEMRRSRRSYKSRGIDSVTAQVIRELTEIVNSKSGLDFRFIEDASSVFSVLSGKISAIAVCGDDSEEARIKSGYYGEMIVLQCVYHGLGTCWVSGTFNESKVLSILALPENKRIFAMIAIGNVKPTLSRKEKIMYNITHKQNKTYQQMLESCDRKLPAEYENAMKLVELAPSGTNSRPVRFKYENGEMSAYVESPYSEKSIDLGIARLHFVIGSAAKGVNGRWNKNGVFCTFNNEENENSENKGEI